MGYITLYTDIDTQMEMYKNLYTVTVIPIYLVRAYHRMGAHYGSMSASPPSVRRFTKRAVSVGVGVVASILAGVRWVGGRELRPPELATPRQQSYTPL